MSCEWPEGEEEEELEEEKEEEAEEEEEEHEQVKWEGEHNCLIEIADKKPCSAEKLVAVCFSPGSEMLYNRLDNTTVNAATK